MPTKSGGEDPAHPTKKLKILKKIVALDIVKNELFIEKDNINTTDHLQCRKEVVEAQ